MIRHARSEYLVLRRAIAQRGALRHILFVCGTGIWAIALMAVLAWYPRPITFLIPLLMLVVTFEAIKPLHFGAERIGRYLQVFYEEGLTGPSPLVGAVGPLQFEVLLHRLEHEYNVVATLHPLGYHSARWIVGNEQAIDEVVRGYGRAKVHDAKGRPLVLFPNEWSLRTAIEKADGVTFHEVAP